MKKMSYILIPFFILGTIALLYNDFIINESKIVMKIESLEHIESNEAQDLINMYNGQKLSDVFSCYDYENNNSIPKYGENTVIDKNEYRFYTINVRIHNKTLRNILVEPDNYYISKELIILPLDFSYELQPKSTKYLNFNCAILKGKEIYIQNKLKNQGFELRFLVDNIYKTKTQFSFSKKAYLLLDETGDG